MLCSNCGIEFCHIDETMKQCGSCRTLETSAERHERHKAERANPRLRKKKKT